MQSPAGQNYNLKMDAEFNGKPMQLDQQGSDMGVPGSLGLKPCSSILNTLQTFQGGLT